MTNQPADTAPAALPDGGLQAERTIMAWWRTLATLAVVDLLSWRYWIAGLNSGVGANAAQIIGALLTALGTLGVLCCFYLRQRRLRQAPSSAAVPAWLAKTTVGFLLSLIVGALLPILIRV